MMRPRSNDFDTIGYVNWPFMSVQTWGETPYGEWGVKVWDGVSGSYFLHDPLSMGRKNKLVVNPANFYAGRCCATLFNKRISLNIIAIFAYFTPMRQSCKKN